MSSRSPYNYHAQEDDPRRRAYIIGSGDLLDVHVWKDPELSTEARVRPDGTITLPLVGDLAAAGQTPAALRGEIAKKLEVFVKNAVVTVAVSEINSYRFTVTGEVAHPGVFAPRPYVTVAEAISLAGGPTRYASSDDVVVIRPTKGSAPRRIPIDYDGILEGDHPDHDIVVLPGDTVWVP